MIERNGSYTAVRGFGTGSSYLPVRTILVRLHGFKGLLGSELRQPDSSDTLSIAGVSSL
ncbi:MULTISPECIES: hypothetical protein [unclassified Paenibacillus]|uniref:hypothetical protein n=1 Tax=unclassified Paenibacillus TaxID=185978 RepID=UPI001AE60FF1|nr:MULTISPECIES: hypothetical protein [unclassified Paenibacillus]MBP1156828.1 hypothetical protein [Paenibacillus sp. PvP091]MBP1172433.1 hypothetical protein [Paenibacillus sp. PvR098]MBP2438814.1 hypothetical protein [Paenibacillus sp. PvP052]